jgi:hypothetical protein
MDRLAANAASRLMVPAFFGAGREIGSGAAGKHGSGKNARNAIVNNRRLMIHAFLRSASLEPFLRSDDIPFRLIELFACHFVPAAIRTDHFDSGFFFVEKVPGRRTSAAVAQRFARAFFSFNETNVWHGWLEARG